MPERQYTEDRSPPRDYQKSRYFKPAPSLEKSLYSSKKGFSWYTWDPDAIGLMGPDGYWLPLHEFSESEIKSHDFLLTQGGGKHYGPDDYHERPSQVINPYRSDVQGLTPFNPTSLAFNTLILGAAQEEPLAAAVGGLLAPSALRAVGNLGRGIMKDEVVRGLASELAAPFKPLKEAANITKGSLKALPKNIKQDFKLRQSVSPQEATVRNALNALAAGSKRAINQSQVDALDVWSPPGSMDVEDIHDFQISSTVPSNISFPTSAVQPVTDPFAEVGDYPTAESVAMQQNIADLAEHFKPTPTTKQVIELHDQEAMMAYKGVRFDGGFDIKNDLEYDWVDKRGSRFEFKMSRREDDYHLWTPEGEVEVERTKYELNSHAPVSKEGKPGGFAYIKFDIANAPILDEKGSILPGKTIPLVNNMHFYSKSHSFGSRPAGRIQAGRILIEFLKKVPSPSLIDEDLLTIDSFFNVINTAIKDKATIVFKDKNLDPAKWFRLGDDWRQGSGISRQSGLSHELIKAHKTGDIMKVKGAWNDILNMFKEKIGTYSEQTGLVEGDPEFTVRPKEKGFTFGEPIVKGQEFQLKYNNLQIQKLVPAIVAALGFKDMYAFKDFLEHDVESMESQVFDQEISF